MAMTPPPIVSLHGCQFVRVFTCKISGTLIWPIPFFRVHQPQCGISQPSSLCGRSATADVSKASSKICANPKIHFSTGQRSRASMASAVSVILAISAPPIRNPTQILFQRSADPSWARIESALFADEKCATMAQTSLA